MRPQCDHTDLYPEGYQGFEQGPIRPPSEAYSLLIRVTRNCPWNYCTFCPIYKGTRFSLRPVDHVKQDIDMVHKFVELLRNLVDASGRISRKEIYNVSENTDVSERPALQAAIHWFSGGMRSIFIQDANSLIQILRKRLSEKDKTINGFNVGMNSGESAGQTIFHSHIHLIPRRTGDTPNPRGGVRGVIPDKMDY